VRSHGRYGADGLFGLDRTRRSHERDTLLQLARSHSPNVGASQAGSPSAEADVVQTMHKLREFLGIGGRGD
jgi:hypothetical protein